MLISSVLSLVLVCAGQFALPVQNAARQLIDSIDFGKTLLGGALSFLLFAAALNVDLRQLREEKWSVTMLASASVVLSTAIIGILSLWIFGWVGLNVCLICCFLFGALISPTDPIAVLGLLKNAHASKSISTRIAGESLLNDAAGLILFIIFYDLLNDSAGFSWQNVAAVLVIDVLGGVLLGLALGWIASLMIARVTDYHVAVLLTLALVSGGYALALALEVSGPLAVVAAGLVLGNANRRRKISERMRNQLDSFWELIDGVLNATLFLLIGLQVLVLKFHAAYLIAALLVVPTVLLARFISVGATAAFMRLLDCVFTLTEVKLITWGGMRGAISIALVLSLPAGDLRDLLLTVTYVVVAFSILVQSLTLPWFLRRVLPQVDAVAT